MADDFDAKRQVGAYLVLHDRALYEVVEVSDGQVLAVNCKTGYSTTLDADDLKAARLITPLPDLPPEQIAELESIPVRATGHLRAIDALDAINENTD